MDPREDQKTLDEDGNFVREPNTLDDDDDPSPVDVAPSPPSDDREPNTREPNTRDPQ